jgi:hypothetical protein
MLEKELSLIKGGMDREVVAGKILQIEISMKEAISRIKESNEAKLFYSDVPIQEAFWNGRLTAHKQNFERLKETYKKLKDLK